MKKTNKNLLLRQIHRSLAPVMLIPLVLTLITGVVYQMFDLVGRDGSVKWLLDLHKGDFGAVNLEMVYPFLNALGLLILVITGFSMWLKMRPKDNRRET